MNGDLLYDINIEYVQVNQAESIQPHNDSINLQITYLNYNFFL